MSELFEHTGKHFKSLSARIPLSEQMSSLLQEQKKSWRLLAEGYAARDSVRQRTVACDGFDVTLQFNPGRMTSTAALVDAASIERRSCFLCVQNLPREQDGLLYSGNFVILCNPAPIFAQHFTISHLDHRPQELEPFLGSLFSLAKDLSPVFSVFYNGPRCGASAPDHMHFQASPAGLIPVERDAQSGQKTNRMSLDNNEIFTLGKYGRHTIIMEGDNAERLGSVLEKFLGSLKRQGGTTEEPMVNILCSFNEPIWRIIIFPRRQHRPEVYFRKDESRILVSPAAVDMGGLVITPAERDFNRLDSKLIEAIYSEVSLDEKTVIRALQALA